MFENQNFVFGVVVNCSEENELTVQLENGETGCVEMAQAARREFKPTARLDWMVGTRRGFCAGEMRPDGRRALSAKAYEEQLFRRIVEDYEQKRRNVYQGHLAYVSKDGTQAYYEIAQGVLAAAGICEFNRMRLSGYQQIAVPNDMPLTIKTINPYGVIRVSGVPAFGDFASNADRLQLTEGGIATGYVSGTAYGGGVIVAFAPNLTMRVPGARVGDWVEVQIHDVNRQEQRINGRILGRKAEHPRYFDFAKWITPFEELPAYIDLREFQSRVCPRVNPVQLPEVSAAPENKLDALIREAEAETPFAVKAGETGVRRPLNHGSAHAIMAAAMNGRLNARHMAAAKAVNALKYSTQAQVREYLRLQENLDLTEAELRSVIGQLVQHDIVHVMDLMDGENPSLPGVLYPGMTNYYKYTGMSRYLPNWQYSAEPDVSMIKCALSANELLLGMLESRDDIAGCENRVYIRTEEDLRIRPRHRLTLCDGTAVYLESARSDWKDTMLEKLQRYDRYFAGTQEKAEVVITLERAEETEAYAREAAALNLKYDVYVTCDSDARRGLPARHVPAHREEAKPMFARLIRWLHQ